MKQIRHGVFETNSSSTHSLTFCTEEEFEKWKAGKLLFDTYNEELVEVDVSITDAEKNDAKAYYERCKKTFWKVWEQLSEEEVEAWYRKYMEDFHKVDKYQYKTHHQYIYDSDLETFTQRYTSPSGDKIVAFGKYGYN